MTTCNSPLMESLETRMLMDGDVTVTVAKGNLLAKGDALDNTIQVIQAGANYVITGVNGTRVNGELSATIPASGNLTFDMGAGNDDVTLSEVFVGDEAAGKRKNILAKMGMGLDVFGLIEDSQAMNVTVLDPQGAGWVTIGGANGGTTLGGKLMVKGGPEANTITIKGSIITKDVNLNLGGGDNDVLILAIPDRPTSLLGALKITSGDGLDEIVIKGEADLVGGAVVLPEGGDVIGVMVVGKVDITTGAGNDTVYMGVSADLMGKVTIKTLAGNDTVSAYQATFTRPYKADLGLGDDAMTVNETIFFDAAQLLGGKDGADLTRLSTTFFVPAIMKNLR